MKKFIVFSIIASLFASCSKDNLTTDDQNSNVHQYITDEISKIETDYVEGAIKIETGNTGDRKNETVASPELLSLIQKDLENSYSKQTTYLKAATTAYGIFKYSTCGGYATLTIRMDTEDSSPRNSHKSGDIGASYVSDKDNNVYLNFCIVNSLPNGIWGSDYVLQLGNTWEQYGYTDQLRRHFDLEDKNNMTRAEINGQRIYGAYGDCNFSSNVTLNWIQAPGWGNSYYGFSYGVLGSPEGYNSPNWIYTDDEDSNNANSFWINIDGNIMNGSQMRPVDREVYTKGVMDVGSNTRMYISWVGTY